MLSLEKRELQQIILPKLKRCHQEDGARLSFVPPGDAG